MGKARQSGRGKLRVTATDAQKTRPSGVSRERAAATSADVLAKLPFTPAEVLKKYRAALEAHRGAGEEDPELQAYRGVRTELHDVIGNWHLVGRLVHAAGITERGIVS